VTRAFIAVGSNLAPERHIPSALRRLAGSPRVRLTALSTFYLVPALDRPEQPDFYNGAVALATDLSPRELKFTVLREIEAQEGRRRSADKYAAREIDLDLVACDDLRITEPDLTLPDLDLAVRPFLAVPLAELAPELVLPGGARPLGELAAALDASALRPLPGFTARLRKELLHES
jgi:2-amino-4-hydroxy-6-hydroxymethyldihydropteridine diphosphokinase